MENYKEMLDKAIALAKEIFESDKERTQHNLFSILKMENKEVSAHSAFIYYLLNPENFENDYNLREFIKIVLGKKIEDEKLKVEREYAEIDGNRVDFVIWINEKPVAIEMKVWAGEQPLQLERYANFVKELGGTSDDVYFLTPNGHQSKTLQSAKCKSFKCHLKSWLHKLSEKYKDEKRISSMVEQYLELIDILTKNYEEDIKRMELITKKEELFGIEELVKARNLLMEESKKNFSKK